MDGWTSDLQAWFLRFAFVQNDSLKIAGETCVMSKVLELHV